MAARSVAAFPLWSEEAVCSCAVYSRRLSGGAWVCALAGKLPNGARIIPAISSSDRRAVGAMALKKKEASGGRRGSRIMSGRRLIERGHHELQIEGLFADARIVVAKHQHNHKQRSSDRSADRSEHRRCEDEP